VDVEGAPWIKVDGATAFGKNDWEPISFDTVADLEASRRTGMATGTVLKAAGFEYQVESAAFSVPHITNAGGAKLSVRGHLVDVLAFGIDNTGGTECSAKFNIAAQWCVAQSRILTSMGIFDHSGSTLAPGGRLTWWAGYTVLRFFDVDTGDLVECKEYPNGMSGLQDAGVYALVDMKDCEGSDVSGSLIIQGAQMNDSTYASRTAVNEDVVAITASQGQASRCLFGNLECIGVGYGLWQGDQRGRGASDPFNNPYTRWSIRKLEVRNSVRPIVIGQSGDGLDDCTFGHIRIAANWGRSIIRGTDLTFQNLFNYGLKAGRDEESETLSITNASTTAVLSSDHAGITVGTVLSISTGGKNKAGGNTTLVTKVTAKSGTDLTLETAPQVTNAVANFMISPPTMEFFGADMPGGLIYVENHHDVPVLFNNKVNWDGVLRISSGNQASRYQAPVLITGDGVNANIRLASDSGDPDTIRRAVAVALQEDGSGDLNSVTVNVGVLDAQEEVGVNMDPLQIVDLLSDHVNSGSTARDGQVHKRSKLSVTYTDKKVMLKKHDATVLDAFEVDEAGRDFDTPVVITAATAAGNFSSPGGGSSDKTTGGTGYLSHPVTAGETYKVIINISSHSAGAPEIRYHNGSTLLSTAFIIGREDGQMVDYITAPATCDQIRLFGFADDEYTIDKFTIKELEAI
jgi:hypothetical protein